MINVAKVQKMCKRCKKCYESDEDTIRMKFHTLITKHLKNEHARHECLC